MYHSIFLGKKINPIRVSAIYDKKSFTGTFFSNTNSVGPSETHEGNSNLVFLIAPRRSSAMFTFLLSGHNHIVQIADIF